MVEVQKKEWIFEEILVSEELLNASCLYQYAQSIFEGGDRKHLQMTSHGEESARIFVNKDKPSHFLVKRKSV